MYADAKTCGRFVVFCCCCILLMCSIFTAEICCMLPTVVAWTSIVFIVCAFSCVREHLVLNTDSYG